MIDENEKRLKALEFLRSQTDSSLLNKEGYTTPLDRDVMKVKSIPQAPIDDSVTKIKGVTSKLGDNAPMKVTSGADWQKKIASKLKGASKATKGIPMLGAVVGGLSALASEDASAGVPILSEASESGPEMGSFDDRLEKGQLTPEELEMMRQLYLGNN